MNKKLTTIMFAFLLLIGKVDAATLTQYVGENYIQQTVKEGQQVRLRFINQANYTFTNWTVESGNITIDTINPTITFTMPNSDVVIRGNYDEEVAAPQNYILNYNANGGTGSMTSQTVTAGEAVNLTTNTFTYDGYTFKGWSEDSSATTATYTDGQSITPTADMTLYAVWEEEVKYTLTYNANNGSGAPSSQTGSTLTISSTTPTRSGWDFAGWGTSSSATSATYQAGDSITLTADTTLYAIWNHTITLTYDANGGTDAPEAQTYTGTYASNSFYLSDTQPTPPSGKAFRGWSTSSSATVADYKSGAMTESVSSNITLYAVYVTPLSSGDLFTGSDVGAWVTYTPSETSYTVPTAASGYESDQTYNPSSYTNWRVFSNDGANVEIIINGIAGKLHLTGSTGYINAVQTLQDLAASYVNSTYAISARSLGYSEEGLTEEEIENYKIIDTDTYPLVYGIGNTFPYSDEQNTSDETVLSNNPTLTLGEGGGAYTWLASRITQCDSTFSRLYVYASHCTGGAIANMQLAVVNKSNKVINSGMECNNGVRPIVTLKSGLTVASGDGSPSNPYVLAEPQLLSDVATVGAYVTYVPSETSYTVTTTASGYSSAQSYNPSNTTSWRVLSNENGTVEIISADSVGTLYLQGATGYTNAVQTLNDMSASFVNSTYATSGRSLGYYDVTRYTSTSKSGSAMTETEKTNYKTIDTSTYPLEYNVSGFPYTDYQYMPDKTALDAHGSMSHSSGYVWLASRYRGTVTSNSYSVFGVMFMYATGSVFNSLDLYSVFDGGSANAHSAGCGVRPIVSLKSGITVTGGSGTSADPYTITIQ